MNQPDRALRRAADDAVFAGILGGIARYFRLDATRVRIAFFALTILSAGFPGILVYLALWFTIPGDS